MSTMGFLAVACSEVPTDSPAELAAPQFKKGGDKGPPTPDDAFSTIVTFRDLGSDNIRSDDRGPYEDGVCGVRADLGNHDDARMHPDAGYSKGKHRKTCGDPRALIIEFDEADGSGPGLPTIEDGVFSNIDQVLAVTGTDEHHRGQFNAEVCGFRLIFNPDGSDGAGSDWLLVSRVGDDTWTVRTQAPPNDKARCSEDGGLFHMPFQMTIQRKP
jgi:hypothetical protein